VVTLRTKLALSSSASGPGGDLDRDVSTAHSHWNPSLVELARTEALVVAAGIKSLLEVPSTMEISRRSAYR
jgi:pseudouridine-5'-phosphate glycosidase